MVIQTFTREEQPENKWGVVWYERKVKRPMASEMIEQVLSAEKKAKEQEEKARLAAAKTVKSAGEKAESLRLAEKETVKAECDAILEKAHEKSDKIYQRVREETEKEQEKLRSLGADRKDASIKSVINHVIPK